MALQYRGVGRDEADARVRLWQGPQPEATVLSTAATPPAAAHSHLPAIVDAQQQSRLLGLNTCSRCSLRVAGAWTPCPYTSPHHHRLPAAAAQLLRGSIAPAQRLDLRNVHKHIPQRRRQAGGRQQGHLSQQVSALDAFMPRQHTAHAHAGIYLHRQKGCRSRGKVRGQRY